MNFIIIFCVCLLSICTAKVFFHEDFANRDKWVDSKSKSDYGKLILSSGEFYGDKKINQGLKTAEDAKFYASSVEIPEVTNDGKEYVVSVSVKHEQGLDCGGGYIKLVPETDATRFDGDTEYLLMFGPDKCGNTNRIHIIFNYKGVNHLWKKNVAYPDDLYTHVYTLRVTPENKYELYVDQELKEAGSLEEDWEMISPKRINDPDDVKPDDWVDEAEIADPKDKKPDHWDDEPEQIVDPEASKPEDWDDAEDGEWETPMISNPKYKGEWTPRRIPNPLYKGVWVQRQIDNPNYAPDNKLYMLRKPIKYVAIDVWQVKSGTIYDNIVIADNLKEVNNIIDKTWKATRDAERKAEEVYNKKAKIAADKKAKDEAAPEADHDSEL